MLTTHVLHISGVAQPVFSRQHVLHVQTCEKRHAAIHLLLYLHPNHRKFIKRAWQKQPSHDSAQAVSTFSGANFQISTHSHSIIHTVQQKKHPKQWTIVPCRAVPPSAAVGSLPKGVGKRCAAPATNCVKPPHNASAKLLRAGVSRICCCYAKIPHSSSPAQAFTAFLVIRGSAASSFQPIRVLCKRPGTVVLPAACFSPDTADVHTHARRAFV